ncbi:MAG TPA: substrate-binding domain-containing protein [Pseudolysinimonas sp.]|jgi:DNA-binding LacI/PurR family transcriptional regulator
MDDGATSTRAGRPTLAAVAARAGVSPSTASLAFSGTGPVSESTRSRVLAAAAELDYAGPDPVARSLRRGRSGVVAVVTEDRLEDAFRDPMNLAVLDGIGEAFGDERLGLLVLPLVGHDRLELLDSAMDAAILLGCGTDLVATVDALRRRRVPIIGIETAPSEGVIAIDLDNRDASRRGAELLRSLGHRDAAVVALPLDSGRERRRLGPRESAGTAFVAIERLAGVRLVFPHATGIATASSSVADGVRAGRALLDVPAGDRPTAIIAQSDLLAAGVLVAADELGIAVPAQLSVVGFDGVRFDGSGVPELTTLVQPASEKGRAAGLAVLAALAGEAPRPAALTSELRTGATTGPAASRP